MKKLFTLFSIFVVFSMVISGCTTVGPDYSPPIAQVQDNWLEQKDPLVDTSPPPLGQMWWQKAFSDPVLNQLVEMALSENLSLRSAGLRVLQAHQQLAIAVGSQYPQQQQISGSAGTNRASNINYEHYDLGFNLSWEADVWGRFKRQIESESASLDARVADYDGVMLSLIAGVAESYLLIRTTQQRLKLAILNLSLQQKSVDITQTKFEEGDVSSLDVNQAETLLYNTKITVTSLEIYLQQLKNSLAVLLGQPPQAMSQLITTEEPIPAVTSEIILGIPQDLIRRRPDIQSSERRLAAQSARIGYAVTDLYPHLGIGGTIGSSISTNGTLEFGDLFSSDGFGYSLFGFFQWNIFNYGRLKNNIRLQDAVFQQYLEDYRGSVLQAQAEVENAIVAFLKSREQLASYQAATEAAQRAADISTLQYKDGLVDFNTVINTLRTLAGQQDQFAAAQGTVATNLVEVNKAIGGSWDLRRQTSPVDLIPEEIRNEMKERTQYWNKVFEKNADPKKIEAGQ